MSGPSRYNREHYLANRDEILVQQRKWREQNPDKKRAADRAYYVKNRGKIKAQARAWRLKNPERARELSRESAKRRRAAQAAPPTQDELKKARQRRERYSQTPKGRQVRDANLRRRRARKHNAFVEDVDREIVFEREGGICGICGKASDPSDWHLDHVIPLARGGEHSYANVQVAHPVCNQRKGARAA